jgi:hypothetical protein
MKSTGEPGSEYTDTVDGAPSPVTSGVPGREKPGQGWGGDEDQVRYVVV